MDNERKTFEVTIAGRDLSLFIGNCAVTLFRHQQEVDYLAVDIEDDQVLRVFNNPDLVRWMAGYRLAWAGDNLDRPQVLSFENVPDSFREMTGFNPAVVEKEEPSEYELDMFLDVNTRDLDGEWSL